ncbi:hyalin-like [Amphiura filiformis]|uniref:hyalin-like n=1 Tax=Amphiura filiformis TaxID=82378 RepID=UPI003B2173D4
MSHTFGTTFNLGTTLVAYNISDVAGNMATCTFNVIVQAAGDTTPPTITFCPSDVTVEVKSGITSAVATWIEPTATDNVTLVNLSTVMSHTSGTTFNLGTTPVVYNISDAAGNMATCTFNVIVTAAGDTTPPTIIFCPSDVTVEVKSGITSAVETWIEPTATDNVTLVNLTTVMSHTSGTTFNLGTTLVVYNISDAAGNMATCTFNVIVQEICLQHTEQSSTHATATSDKAVDGNTNGNYNAGSCAHTRCAI